MTEVLVVEDTPSLRRIFESVLRNAGLSVSSAGTLCEAREAFDRLKPKVLVLDLALPDGDGLDLMHDCRGIVPETNAVIVTANGSIRKAVAAMRAGAHDFLAKPFEHQRLVAAVRNALEDFGHRAPDAFDPDMPLFRFHGFIGDSAEMKEVYARMLSVAHSMATVFICGENGTGKSLCAQAIHASSPRAHAPFVRLECAALGPERLESELFGHFDTPAPGAATAADRGTLFLNDVCDMDLRLQAKLLRFLQTSTVRPVGAAEPVKVDARIICATDRDPLEEVRQGRFRQDLYYRLFVIPITLPPLRNRGKDVLQIARDVLLERSQQEGKHFSGLSDEVAQLFMEHDWPGNVRQLMNLLHSVVVLHDGDLVTRDMLPAEAGIGAPARKTTDPSGSDGTFAGMTLAEIERHAIEGAIARHEGSIPRAARELNVAPSTIYRKRESWHRTTS